MSGGNPHREQTTPESIRNAAKALRGGRLVAFPTETVYGLGAVATNGEAMAAIFKAKRRPSFNPLIIHVLGCEAAGELVVFDHRAQTLADKFWPGALTLVLPRTNSCPVSLLAGAGLDTLAVRAPAHEVARALLRAAALPIAAPSANASGAVSPTTAAHVAESLGDAVDLILDSGPCRIGLESTVIDLSGPDAAILRPGSVTIEEIEAVIGRLATPGDEQAPLSPGMLARHYATSIPLRLNATSVRPGEALLAFGSDRPAGAARTINLSPAGDLAKAAANLFAMMRILDRPDFTGIAVMPIPERGLGQAINDRLRRAAHG
jgi:L-threonylcarbamoyladenylate synthase